MSLVAVIEQFQEVSDEQRIKLDKTWEELQEDVDNSVAVTICQQIEYGEVTTKKDLFDLMESLKDYKTREVDSFLDISYEYSFTPPTDEFPLEYADSLHKQRLLTITEDGQWMEVNDEGVEIGPVDRDHNPVEGHPEYMQVKLPIPGTEPASLGFPIKIVEDLDTPALEELMQAVQIQKVAATKEPLPELKEVFLETDIGSLLFEPETAMLAGRAFIMTFDTSRTKPPLYPRVGSNFRLKYKNHDLPVTYMDISFNYKDRKFMIFIVLDEEGY